MSQPFASPLSTPRLILRRLQDGDSAALCSYRSLPQVARYQGWDSFGPDDAARLIESQRHSEPGVPGTWFQLAIVEKLTGNLVGDCGLHCLLDDPRQMEFGITLAPSHQGHGYATEALRCLLAFVFGTLGKHRVSAITAAENHAAASLFRRLGFRQEAHHIEHRWYKGYWDSEFVFGLLRREWELRQPPGQEFANSLPPTPVGEIREYRPADESACLEIFDSNRPKYFTASERDLFVAYLQRMDQPFFVTEVAGQVRACGGFRVDDFGVGFLEWGMVHAHWHRKGAGANLLHYRLERIRQTTHAWCVLIDTSQHTAPFFARFGFEPYRTNPDGYQPGLDKIFMRLLWTPPRERSEPM